jgi:hypothetical protein
MRCLKNDYAVADPDPLTYWVGDLYGCPGCATRVVTGFSLPFQSKELLPREGVSLRFIH